MAGQEAGCGLKIGTAAHRRKRRGEKSGLGSETEPVSEPSHSQKSVLFFFCALI